MTSLPVLLNSRFPSKSIDIVQSKYKTQIPESIERRRHYCVHTYTSTIEKIVHLST